MNASVTCLRAERLEEFAALMERERICPVRFVRRVARKSDLWMRKATIALNRIVKRQIDVVGSFLLLLISSPLLIVVALAIKLNDGGPIFFRQLRVGKHGKAFLVPKFRSMVPRAEHMLEKLAAENHHGDSITFKMKRDPRITPVGRFLRRFSIDEIPQLFCILQGDMSLVGPRPALLREVAHYTQRQRRRLEAVPGLTCIWQVSGRGDIPFDQQLRMDLDYIERQNLLLDSKLLLLTVPAVLTGRGAY
jgi:lipopolysaccharide/colanic/teichoic acid biosynthesis glycosyltransferase